MATLNGQSIRDQILSNVPKAAASVEAARNLSGGALSNNFQSKTFADLDGADQNRVELTAHAGVQPVSYDDIGLKEPEKFTNDRPGEIVTETQAYVDQVVIGEMMKDPANKDHNEQNVSVVGHRRGGKLDGSEKSKKDPLFMAQLQDSNLRLMELEQKLAELKALKQEIEDRLVVLRTRRDVLDQKEDTLQAQLRERLAREGFDVSELSDEEAIELAGQSASAETQDLAEDLVQTQAQSQATDAEIDQAQATADDLDQQIDDAEAQVAQYSEENTYNQKAGSEEIHSDRNLASTMKGFAVPDNANGSQSTVAEHDLGALQASLFGVPAVGDDLSPVSQDDNLNSLAADLFGPAPVDSAPILADAELSLPSSASPFAASLGGDASYAESSVNDSQSLMESFNFTALGSTVPTFDQPTVVNEANQDNEGLVSSADQSAKLSVPGMA